mmetsp:Transcript_2126/g.6673  ORF Transcript_2126/g.6673 Transcript_2126/m.6673 type:complete len:96 (+) Transcript_2126:287-574(+)
MVRLGTTLASRAFSALDLEREVEDAAPTALVLILDYAEAAHQDIEVAAAAGLGVARRGFHGEGVDLAGVAAAQWSFASEPLPELSRSVASFDWHE